MKNKQVFILKNLKSRNVEQAIIILRDNASAAKEDIVKEAEEIIGNYLSLNNLSNHVSPVPPVKDDTNLKRILNALIFIAVFILFYLIVKFLF